MGSDMTSTHASAAISCSSASEDNNFDWIHNEDDGLLAMLLARPQPQPQLQPQQPKAKEVAAMGWDQQWEWHQPQYAQRSRQRHYWRMPPPFHPDDVVGVILTDEQKRTAAAAEAASRAEAEQRLQLKRAHEEAVDAAMLEWEETWDQREQERQEAAQGKRRNRPRVPLFNEHTSIAPNYSTSSHLYGDGDGGCAPKHQTNTSKQDGNSKNKSKSMGNDFKIMYNLASAGRKASTKLKHCIDVVESLAPAPFKIGITHDPVMRVNHPEYGYRFNFDNKEFKRMVVLVQSAADQRAEAPMLEAALINHFRNHSRCLNVAPGGEGYHAARENTMYVYVVALGTG